MQKPLQPMIRRSREARYASQPLLALNASDNPVAPFIDFVPVYVKIAPPVSRLRPKLFRRNLHPQSCEGSMTDLELYTNLTKCIFCAPEIPVLGSYVSKELVHADPEKVGSSVLGLRLRTRATPTVVGTRDIPSPLLEEFRRDSPLLHLLKADTTWSWRPEHQAAFEAIKMSQTMNPDVIYHEAHTIQRIALRIPCATLST
ncbi:Polyprotein [Phytophthora palmivora]|uniref:Polyprotein n=1 Tax=Phytophthora palmivora TaxID=4796 RepID=A0A2P4Y588_9STRA|nr:Polyprotein [Phytophthora palmivora]